MKIIDKIEYLKLREEDTIALSVKSDEIFVKADIEYNENQEEEYGEFRINEYSWVLPRKNEKPIFEMLGTARGFYSSGINIYVDKNAHNTLLEYVDETATIMLFDSEEEQMLILPILANGDYIFVFKSDNKEETQEYREYVKAITDVGLSNICRLVESIKKAYTANPSTSEIVNVFSDTAPLFSLLHKLRRKDVCPKCGSKNFFKSDLPQYEAVCTDCDENFF